MTLEVNLEDVEQFDAELAADVLENTRRYQGLFSDVVFELLPNYKLHEVTAKDALDVFIEHRLLVEQRVSNKTPKELSLRIVFAILRNSCVASKS